jgi:hypothetical protein
MLSLPLAKLSSAQDVTVEETKFNWSHDTQNLIVVVDTYGASGPPSQLLKVVQGTQVRVRAPLSTHRTQPPSSFEKLTSISISSSSRTSSTKAMT